MIKSDLKLGLFGIVLNNTKNLFHSNGPNAHLKGMIQYTAANVEKNFIILSLFASIHN